MINTPGKSPQFACARYKFTPGTQHTYVRFVKEFSIFFDRSPDKAAFEDVRLYQLHSTSRGVSPFTINAAVTALRFFSRVTLRRHDIAHHISLSEEKGASVS